MPIEGEQNAGMISNFLQKKNVGTKDIVQI